MTHLDYVNLAGGSQILNSTFQGNMRIRDATSLKKHYQHRTGTTRVITITGIYHGYSRITGIYIACIVSPNPQLPASYRRELVNYRMITAGSKILPA